MLSTASWNWAGDPADSVEESSVEDHGRGGDGEALSRASAVERIRRFEAVAVWRVRGQLARGSLGWAKERPGGWAAVFSLGLTMASWALPVKAARRWIGGRRLTRISALQAGICQ